MTTNQLAAGYYRKCVDRLAALAVLVQRQAFSDVVRESQEIVELAPKGMLRAVGVDPPNWHDTDDSSRAYGYAETATTMLGIVLESQRQG